MLMYNIIRKKRDGEELSSEEIAFWIKGCVDGSIPDYQSAALLMAGRIRGFTHKETIDMVENMVGSGGRINLAGIPGIKADKHSTGGVGDKTSMVVMPIVASAGLKVAKISGRGIGHTGGTVDKLTSIPGFSTDLSVEEFKNQVKHIGISIISQTVQLVPADKKLYALRDLTATVDSIPLVAASIMSKKIATGADILALDVKFGSGAVLKNIEDSRELARIMVKIAAHAGIKTAALLTSMDQPLGYAVGNALEVKEILEVLAGGGPQDLRELALAIAAQLFVLGEMAADKDTAWRLAQRQLNSGAALAKFNDLVLAQGGNIDFSRLPEAGLVMPYRAPKSGFILSIDAQKIGFAALSVGAGRVTMDSDVDYAAGVIVRKKIGCPVNEGDVIAEVHCQTLTQFDEAVKFLNDAFVFGATPPQPAPLILEIIS